MFFCSNNPLLLCHYNLFETESVVCEACLASHKTKKVLKCSTKCNSTCSHNHQVRTEQLIVAKNLECAPCLMTYFFNYHVSCKTAVAEKMLPCNRKQIGWFECTLPAANYKPEVNPLRLSCRDIVFSSCSIYADVVKPPSELGAPA